jgi:hypothetical protein
MKAAHAALYNKLYEMMEDDDWVHAALAADGLVMQATTCSDRV